ncbi:MAG: hypothetical protein NVS9B15_16130 [Acidobacteriaceae bacterium]
MGYLKRFSTISSSSCVAHCGLLSLLPAIDGVPVNFLARIAWWEMQLLPWVTLGVLFGWLKERDQRT